MTRLEVRLLGGFDVRLAGQPVTGFESQKVRALLAYLVANEGKPISRELLASLLWSGKSPESSRRNLRQALHNLRSACAAVDPSTPVIQVQRHDLEIDPDLELFLDVREFERGIERAFADTLPDTAVLAAAARHYEGDFLAGFFIKDSPPFEEWMILEQERLREAAIEAYRVLLRIHLAAGEHRVGIDCARRLLILDPLSEEAHRQLMHLYSEAGRRGPALALYDKLRNMLNSELGVEPLAETAALYESILAEQRSTESGEERPGAVGPLIPLVGRGEAFSQLQESWRQVVEGRGRITLIQGGSGIGKTRLARSFVDGVTAQRRAVVLSGRSRDAAPLVGFGLIADVLASAFAESLPEEQEERAAELSDQVVTDLTRLAPRLLDLVPAISGRLLSESRTPSARHPDSLVEFLEQLMQVRDDPLATTPAIVLIDDLQWADPDSLALLRSVGRTIGDKKIWILATCRSGGLTAARLLPEPADRAPHQAPIERLTLTTLGPEEHRKIADFLVGPESAEALAGYLVAWSVGIPETVAELLNFLWDEGVLVPQGNGRWALSADPAAAPPPVGDLDELVALRVHRLPASARRLLTVAAALGQEFDTHRLRAAEREDPDVVDRCIQLLLERWLIRQSAKSWSLARRPSDLARWAEGARRGPFEFNHEVLRAAVLAELNPLRLQAIHRTIAESLEEHFGARSTTVCEDLAYHYLASGEWRPSLAPLETAQLKSHVVGATEVAAWYEGKLGQVLDRLIRQAETESERTELAARRDRLGRTKRRKPGVLSGSGSDRRAP